MFGHIEGLEVPVEIVAEGQRLSLRELGALRKGSLVRVPGIERGEASFRMGGRSLFRMKARARGLGKARVLEIVDKPRDEELSPNAPVALRVEASGTEVALRSVLGDFQAGLVSSLTAISKGIAALLEKQNEMTDQLAFAPPDQGEGPEPAAMRGLVRPFDFVSRADPAHVLNLIAREHPQTIALVLSYLEAQHASVILGSLPPEIQGDVARRIAVMGPTRPEVVREAERVIERKLSSMSSDDYLVAGGVDDLAQILNLSNRSTERHVIETLQESDFELSEEIKKRMFVFEDIVLLDRAAVAKVVKRSSS